jgi:hypothetical protein
VGSIRPPVGDQSTLLAFGYSSSASVLFGLPGSDTQTAIKPEWLQLRDDSLPSVEQAGCRAQLVKSSCDEKTIELERAGMLNLSRASFPEQVCVTGT